MRKTRKIRENQWGIAHLVVIIVCVVAAIVVLVGWRVSRMNPTTKFEDAQNTESSQNSSGSLTENDQPDTLVLKNLGVDLAQVNYTDQAVREYKSMGLKGFYVFGEPLGGKPGDTRLNPNFEFSSVAERASVISAIDGEVAFIKEQQESGDFEVFIQPKNGSIWTVGYDHISEVAVTKGQKVSAGDHIGVATAQGNGLHRFEIQINKDVSGETTHVCPSTLLDPAVKPALLTGLEEMQTKWETTTGLELYNIAAQSPAGCVYETMSPAQAEGR